MHRMINLSPVLLPISEAEIKTFEPRPSDYTLSRLLGDLGRAALQLPAPAQLPASIFELRDAVVQSTLQFSQIRMKNAMPPD